MTRREQEFVVGKADEFQEGGKRIVEIAGRTIGVYRSNGEFFAVLNRCPHALAPICMSNLTDTTLPSRPGEYVYGLAGFVLRCPWHKWEWDIRTGRTVFGTDHRRLATFPVAVKDGCVVVTMRVSDDQAAEPGVVEVGHLDSTESPG